MSHIYVFKRFAVISAREHHHLHHHHHVHPYESLTILNVVRLLALLVDHDDDHQDEDLGQDPQQGPQGGQVAAHPQDGGDGGGSDHVGGVALVLPRVQADVQVVDVQLGVVVLVAHGEAAGRVVDVLGGGG